MPTKSEDLFSIQSSLSLIRACLGLCLRDLKVLLTLKKFVSVNKYSFGKKIISAFNGPKSLKIAKTHFWQKLKNEAFAQKLFLT